MKINADVGTALFWGLVFALIVFLSGCASRDMATHKCADAPRDSAWARSNCR